MTTVILASITCLEGYAGTTSFYRPVPTREHVYLREAAFKVRKDWGIRCLGETLKKGMKRLTLEGDMRRNIFMGNIDIPCIFIVSYSFPQPFVSEKKGIPPSTIRRTRLTQSPRLA
jgi:hypothetical protein